MSKPTIADVQTKIDQTVILLSTMLATRKLSTLERSQISNLVSDLQQCSRSLPELAKSGKGFSAVFDKLADLISYLFRSQ